MKIKLILAVCFFATTLYPVENKVPVKKLSPSKTSFVKKDLSRSRWQYVPARKSSVSPTQLVLLDLLIPGYGLFAQNRFWWGIIYATAKITAGVGIYFATTTYSYWNSLYLAAKKRQDREATQLWFQNPDSPDEYYTVRELQNKADTKFLFLLYAILAEAVIYTVSGVHTYHLAKATAVKSGPFYTMDNSQNEMNLGFGWRQKF